MYGSCRGGSGGCDGAAAVGQVGKRLGATLVGMGVAGGGASGEDARGDAMVAAAFRERQRLPPFLLTPPPLLPLFQPPHPRFSPSPALCSVDNHLPLPPPPSLVVDPSPSASTSPEQLVSAVIASERRHAASEAVQQYAAVLGEWEVSRLQQRQETPAVLLLLDTQVCLCGCELVWGVGGDGGYSRERCLSRSVSTEYATLRPRSLSSPLPPPSPLPLRCRASP